ncbi:olfactomedin-4-like isoform X1 [Ambystoma mexicanum]|uniref:olfactomedin-4-like isoform X1 n=2 Tax=Ambystoma mexicanum TaxID=8296 RepID=UPI0037E867ED
MLLCLLLAASLVQGHAASSNVQHVNGSMNENGQCLCTVILPDTTFPADRMESLVDISYSLNISVQQEITKIHSYQQTLNIYLQKITNLTIRVEAMEGASYTELDFELLKLEIKEMESLILELKLSMDGTNVIVETLYEEIRNISVMVNQLEKYDKNNVLAVRREIVALRKRLENCEKNNTRPTPPPPPSYGTCSHGGFVNVSKPFVVQLNYRGFTFKYGGWGKDSFMNSSNKDMYWISALDDSRIMRIVRSHPSLDDLLLYKKYTDKTLQANTYLGQGSGMIMYNNILYYNCYNSGNLCKYNLQTNTYEARALPLATFNNRFSYAGVAWQDIDLAADESGLWVIYSTEDSVGNIVISKLNASSLEVEKTWTTSQYKPGVTNAFMICGVLYATRAVNTRTEEIFFMYDTKTSQQGKVSIFIDKIMELVQSLTYNPNDHKLYMYSDGYEVTYDVIFKPAASQK